MEIKKLSERTSPFGALIGISSLIAALLFVSGFAYRWSYYYNFGVQHVVYKLSFQSFLITAIELVRDPKNLLLSFLFIVCPLILVNSIIRLIKSTANSAQHKLIRNLGTLLIRLFGLESSLVVDSIRALIILYTVYMLSSYAGYTTFKKHIVNSPDNTLPAVTVIIEEIGGENRLALSCGAEEGEAVQLIGDAKRVREIQETYRTCNTSQNKWRLLYRDDETIYVFASKPEELIAGTRPLTLVLPNNKRTYLIME